jgi:hypothetical protein
MSRNNNFDFINYLHNQSLFVQRYMPSISMSLHKCTLVAGAILHLEKKNVEASMPS